jgi:CheY-like chemotaxis protein
MKAPLRILAVEDDEQDVELLRMALAGAGVALETVGDGAAALAFLRHQGPYARKPRQNLVLLDLNMPRMGGRAFLAERRADPDLLSIPVVVLTTSASPRDVGDSYALGANCFVTKPVGYENFRAALAAVARFWSSVAERPGRREA